MDPSPTPQKPVLQFSDFKQKKKDIANNNLPLSNNTSNAMVPISSSSASGGGHYNNASSAGVGGSSSNNMYNINDVTNTTTAVGGDIMMVTKEEDITKDDLQAMKDMIGDIKKDPSLLYRLSSLPGDNHNTVAGVPSATTMQHMNPIATTQQTQSTCKIFVDDDATDVSSLGMMSSNNDYIYGTMALGGPILSPNNPQSPSTSSNNNMILQNNAGGGGYNVNSSSNSFAQATATAIKRTNHDAEIALRMQSLRAKRLMNNQQQGNNSTNASPRVTPSKNNRAMSAGRARQQQQQQQQQFLPMKINADTRGPIPNDDVLGSFHAASPSSRGGMATVDNGGEELSVDSPERNPDHNRFVEDDLKKMSDPPPPPPMQQNQTTPSTFEQSPRRNDTAYRRLNSDNRGPIPPTDDMLSYHVVEDRKSDPSANGGHDYNLDNDNGDDDDMRRKSDSMTIEKKKKSRKKDKKGSRRSSDDRRKTKDKEKDNDDDDSAALVLYQQEGGQQQQHQQPVVDPNNYDNVQGGGALTIPPSQAVVSREGSGGYNNYHIGQLESHHHMGASGYYYSGVSKYANQNEGMSRSPIIRSDQNGIDHNESSKASKSSSSSRRHGRNRSNFEASSSDFSHMSSASTSSRVSTKSKRSRSELPRERKSKDRGGDRVSRKGKNRLRSSSEQPNHKKADGNKKESLSSRPKAQRTQSFIHSRKYSDDDLRYPHPPPQAQSSEEQTAPLDAGSLIKNLHDEQKQHSSYDMAMDQFPPSTNPPSNNERPRLKKITSGRRFSDTSELSSSYLQKTSNYEEKQRSVSTGMRERADTDPVGGKEGKHDTNNGDSNHSNYEHQESPPPPPPPESSTPSSLGHGLAHLSMLDALDEGKKSRPSVASESGGRSVISRLSQLRRKTSKRSVSSGDVGAASSHSHSGYLSRDINDLHNSSESPLKPIGLSDSYDPNDSKLGLVRRFSSYTGGASPKNSQFRQRPTFDDDANDDDQMTTCSIDNHERLSQSERPSIGMTEESDPVTQGIDLAMSSGDVPRLCDERGRCIFHPHIRLQKPKLLGGWKVLYQHCPDCAVEHMKKTQEKLATIQKQKAEEHQRRKLEKKKKRIAEKEKIQKEREREKEKKKQHPSDPIIGTDVGDQDFAAENKTAKKRAHHRKKKERERIRKELAESRNAAPKPVYADEEDGNRNNEQNLDVKPNDSKDQNQQHKQQERDQYPPHRQQEPPLQQEVQKQEPQEPPQQHEPQEEVIKEPPADESLAIVPHQPMRKKVNGLPWSDYNGQSGRYTGEVNDQYLPHGQGEMVYDRGVKTAGMWYNGVLDTEDTAGGLRMEKVVATQEAYTPDTLPHYSIGDRGNEEDMIIDNKKNTAAAVSKIRPNDAAFVRRSDGSWTYAVVKDRTYGKDETIRFKVNVRGSTKAFPTSQWGTYVRRVKKGANARPPVSLGLFLDKNKAGQRAAQSVAGNMMRGHHSSDISVGSAQSAPMMNGGMHRNADNLTTAKMKIRTRSRSRSRNRKNITTLPLLFSSSMSVSEENEGYNNDDWETASGSGYRLRGIDP